MSKSEPSTDRPEDKIVSSANHDPDATLLGAQTPPRTDLDLAKTQPLPPEATFASPTLPESPNVQARLNDADSAEKASQRKTVDFSQWSGPDDGSSGPEETLRAPHDLQSLGFQIELDPSVNEHEQVAEDGVSAAREAGFSVESVLGEGGMGTVFAGRQNSMDRPVAIKVLKGDAANALATHQLFVSEAIITGSLDHPNIVPIYDVGGQDKQAPFYAMKQIEGVEWTDRFSGNSVEENVEILLRVCDAMAFAHERGIIHRDLKPANIMLGPFGEVLVMDWGLAIPAPDHPKRDEFPFSPLGGTPYYMAPEMVLDVGKIDRRSDVYLLGGILFAIVTGKAPHAIDEPPVEVRERLTGTFEAVAGNVLAPTEKSGKLLDIALQALSTDPADRHQSVGEFQQAIREYRAHQESIELAKKSDERLEEARATGNYVLFSRARFGFETALEQWPGNLRAQEGLEEACLAYAETAFQRGDYDLAKSLLNENEPTHETLYASIKAAIDERRSRQRQVTLFKRLSVAAVALVAVVATGAAIWIKSEHSKAETARIAESKQREIATTAREKAVEAKLKAEESEKEAVEARLASEASERAAVAARHAAEESERAAKRDRDKAERQAYYSDMMLLRESAADFNVLNMRQLLARHRDQDHLRNFEWEYWNGQLDRAVFTSEPGQSSQSLTFSPDGRTLAATQLGRVQLFETRSPKKSRFLTGANKLLLDVAFSPNGKTVVAVGNDTKAHFWDFASGKKIKTLPRHDSWCTGVAFSPDGSFIVTTGFDSLAKVWNATTDELVMTYDKQPGGLRTVAFHPSGSRVATAGNNGAVHVWAFDSGEKLLSLESNSFVVHRLDFSSNGKWLASAGQDGRVVLWNADSGKKIATLVGHRNAVRDVNFSPNNDFLVSSGHDRTVKVWKVPNGDLVETLLGHADTVHAAAVSPDGSLIASGDNTLRMWQPYGGATTAEIPLPQIGATRIDLTADGTTLFAGGAGGEVAVVDLVSRQVIERRKAFDFAIQDVVVSPDGNRLAASSGSKIDLKKERPAGVVKVWQLGRDETIGRSSQIHLGNVTELQGFPKGAYGLSFSPDSRRLATANHNKLVSIFDVHTGAKVHDLLGNMQSVLDVHFDPTGTFVTAVGCDCNVRIWNRDSQDLVVDSREKPTSWTTTCVASPDGKRILTGHWFGHLMAWDVKTGKRTLMQAGHTGVVSGISFTADGKRFASSSRDGSVKVWDAENLQETMTFNEPTPVWDVVFRPDGRQLFAAMTNRVKVWDASVNDEQQRLETRVRGYLTVHVKQASSLQDLKEKITADETISDQVRQEALESVASFWNARSGK